MTDREKARKELLTLTPQQRLENIEYLMFRLFMQATELPAPPEKEKSIFTVDDLGPPQTPQMPVVGIPYDLAYARAAAEQIIETVGGNVAMPQLLHAIRAAIHKFEKQANEALAKAAAEEEEAKRKREGGDR